MERFVYEGPVTDKFRVIHNNWKCETYAVSDKKAKSNMKFQYRRAFGLAKTAKIFLPCELKVG